MKDKLLAKMNLIIALLLIAGTLTAAQLEQINSTSAQTMTNKTLVQPVLSGTVTGTYGLSGTYTLTSPTIASPTFSGTASGSLTNLTLATPTITGPSMNVEDFRFILHDNVDNTKVGFLELSGLSTGTTRTWSLPDATTTLVGTGVTQTLTNKTLTSPTINTPTISSPTLSGTATGTYTLGGTPSVLSGIAFPATQNASADANTLDDYEEGTWTPSVGGSATYSARVGRYTKIGRSIHLDFSININTIGTGSTTQVTGVPFASSSTYISVGSCSFAAAASSLVFIVVQIGSSSTTLIFPAITAASSGVGTPAIFGNGTQLSCSITYGAAS